jgi:hypothetical protein
MTAASIPAGTAPAIRRWATQALVAGLGLLLMLGALRADPAWFDRHFLPVFFVPYALYRAGETAARIATGLAGLGLIVWAAPAAGRWAERAGLRAMAADAVRILLAAALAALVCEAGLNLVFPRGNEAPQAGVEPLRQADARLGWLFEPGRTARQVLHGRAVDYVFDPQGFRVASPAEPVDFTRPSILFAGESIVTGAGLPWDQTFAALTARALGLQPANLSVFAYSDDQTYMRLHALLPRFEKPAAVVILFSPGLMFRDLDVERPHLGPALDWRPAEHGPRLLALLRLFVPYHGSAAIDRAALRVRDELSAAVREARARGADPLIVVPRFGREDPREAALRRRVLDDAGLPYIAVELDPAWRQRSDPHPDARGAQALAKAITAALDNSAGARGVSITTE